MKTALRTLYFLLACFGLLAKGYTQNPESLRDSLFVYVEAQDLERAYTFGDKLSSLHLANQDSSLWLIDIKAAGTILRNSAPAKGYLFYSHYKKKAISDFGLISGQTAMVQSLLAECLYKQEKYHEALPAFESALDLFDKANIRDEFTGKLYHKTANTYVRFWDRPRTIDYLKRAYSIFELNNSEARMARVICDLNIALFPEGKYEEIKENAFNWVSHSATEEEQRCILMIQLAQSGLETEDYTLYQTYSKKAEILLEQVANSRRLRRDWLSLKAKYHSEIGNSQIQLNALSEALENVINPDREIATLYIQYGEAQIENKLPEEALLSFNNAFRILLSDTLFSISKNPPSVFNLPPEPWLMRLYMQTGLAFFQLENPEAGIQWANSALKHASSVRNIQSREEAQLYIAKILRPATEQVITQTIQAIELDTKLEPELFSFMLAARTAVLNEKLGFRIAKREAGIPAELIELENNLIQKHQTYFFEGNKDSADRIARRLDTIERYYFKAFPKFKEKLVEANESPSLSEFRTHYLDEDEALLLYFLGSELSHGILVSQKDFIYAQVDTSGLHKWKQVLSKGNGEFKTAHQLYNGLCKSLLSPLTIKPKQLIIAGDGALNQIPFESLLSQAPTDNKRARSMKWLIKEYAISYLHHNQFEFTSSSSTLNFAGFAPQYKNGSQQALFYNIEEVKHIATILKGKTWTGEQATVEAFRTNSANAKIIHVAAHGFSDNTNPDNSWLAFNKEQALRVAEIKLLNLNTDLTVLSACKTGEGKIEIGEGIMSLGRAFSEAGSNSLILSLWEVDDQTTGELMKHFYNFLKAGDSKSVALQKAKLEFLSVGSDPITAHPSYWSSFILTGNTSPVEFSINGQKIPLTLIISALIGLIILFIVKNKNDTNMT